MKEKDQVSVTPSEKQNAGINIYIGLWEFLPKFETILVDKRSIHNRKKTNVCRKLERQNQHLVNITSRQLPYPRATARAFFFHYENLNSINKFS